MDRSARTPRLLAGLLALACLVTVSGPLREHASAFAARTPFAAHTDTVEVRFTRSTPAGPVVWSTCDPVEVLVNPGPFGEFAAEEIRSAFAEVSAITGLRFVFTPSTLVPRTNWALTAGEWAVPPVLVAWVEPSETDLLSPSASGATVANPATVDGVKRIVTGAVVFDAGEYEDFAGGAGPGKTRRNLLLHEIGHLLGLEHVESAGLMHPAITGRSPAGLHPVEVTTLRSAYAGSHCTR
jgi:hypothetical protein